MKGMKEQLNRLPKSLQKQVMLRLGAGIVFLFLFVVLLIGIRDLYLSLPCLLLAAFLLISGGDLFYNSIKGEYVRIQGVCERIETVGIRKRIRSISISFDGHWLKIPVRKRINRLSVGDAVIIYLPEKEPVYEQDGGYLVCGYYALETEKKGVK